MSACGAFGAGIADVALGAVPDETLQAHLQQCDACAAELGRQRALARRLGAALGALAQPEPPAGMVENVLARVRSRAAPHAGRQLATALAGVALAACVIVFLVRFQGGRAGVVPAQSTALTSWRSPTLSLLEDRESVLRSPLRASRFSLDHRSLHS